MHVFIAYREADDDASGEDERPPAANLGSASVAVVADDGLDLPNRINEPINPGGLEKEVDWTLKRIDLLVIYFYPILSFRNTLLR